MSLPYRLALVTDASSGLGRAIAAALRSEGLEVLALGRDAQALATLAAETGAQPVVADIRDRTQLARLIVEFPIDVLINNAGVLPSHGPFQTSSLDDLDALVSVNVLAPLALTHMVLPGMIERRRGHILFIGSSAGRTPHPDLAVYGATKAAIGHFADSLRGDLLGTGVRVTEIAPGRARSKLYRDAVGLEHVEAALYEGVDPIEPEDIAALAVMALSTPARMDVSRIEAYPASQAIAGTKIFKRSPD